MCLRMFAATRERERKGGEEDNGNDSNSVWQGGGNTDVSSAGQRPFPTFFFTRNIKPAGMAYKEAAFSFYNNESGLKEITTAGNNTKENSNRTEVIKFSSVILGAD